MINIRNVSYFALIVLLIVSMSISVYFVLKTLQFNPTLKKADAVSEPAYHFVLISEKVGNPYWNHIKEGAKEAGKKYGAMIEYTGPVQPSTELHVKAVEKAIAAKVDGIITQGLDSSLMTPVINKAIQKGIQVITIDTDAPESRRLSYVGTNNYRAGHLAGKTLIKDLDGKAKVGIITGSFYSKSQQQRVKGFRDAIKDEAGIEIVSVKASNISQIQAAEETYKMFSKHQINALFGTSALDGSGIAAVVQLLDKTDSVYIIAFDALPETINLIEEGIIDATIVQKPYEMGYQSVEMMVNLMEGKEIPNVFYTDISVVKASDLPLPSSPANQGSELR